MKLAAPTTSRARASVFCDSGPAITNDTADKRADSRADGSSDIPVS